MANRTVGQRAAREARHARRPGAGRADDASRREPPRRCREHEVVAPSFDGGYRHACLDLHAPPLGRARVSPEERPGEDDRVGRVVAGGDKPVASPVACPISSSGTRSRASSSASHPRGQVAAVLQRDVVLEAGAGRLGAGQEQVAAPAHPDVDPPSPRRSGRRARSTPASGGRSSPSTIAGARRRRSAPRRPRPGSARRAPRSAGRRARPGCRRSPAPSPRRRR